MPIEQITQLEKDEQYMSAVTHGLGVVATLIAFPFIMYQALAIGSFSISFGMAVFMLTLLMVYLSSTVYHYYYFTPYQNVLRTIDHICIYFLIAGTNTPFIYLYHQNGYGSTLLALFWGLVLVGTLYKIFYIGKNEFISLFFYVFMGWMGLLTLYPIFEMVSTPVYYLIIIGGVLYSAGTYFYTKEEMPYHHSIWHLFVMGGSVTHFFAIYYTLIDYGMTL